MKKSNKSILYLTIIVLVIAIAILVGVIINLSNANNTINKQEESQGQQLTETTSSNAYVDMETHLSEVNAKQQELDNIQNTAGQATATASQILKNYTAYKDGKLITGTMANRMNTTTAWSGYETISLQAHPSDSSQGLVTITNTYGATGYYDNSSKITGNIANLNAANIRAGVKVGRADGTSGITGTFTSDATATATDIASGKTAYVNGKKVTGTASGSNVELVATKLSNGTSGSSHQSDSFSYTANESCKYMLIGDITWNSHYAFTVTRNGSEISPYSNQSIYTFGADVYRNNLLTYVVDLSANDVLSVSTSSRGILVQVFKI